MKPNRFVVSVTGSNMAANALPFFFFCLKKLRPNISESRENMTSQWSYVSPRIEAIAELGDDIFPNINGDINIPQVTRLLAW